ncbi:unnamed protein product (macronuclear) [Paramecium tetraurelia]|uniref:Kelch motif family protein n=1 Tax=Paramecium tetraurelia TaxID=5888 RepID=A0D2Q7_PARTE|nr:uncharacterized protein GSPATT00012832001 [Paramecium tetraurelia]CAK77324.1 unnamed protein product [Paramecium tetraurelia]|eukprot:XP_001444721.1 hypothetical protein (macronuclear) [Paramecium tetraurelia strain d4-2]
MKGKKLLDDDEEFSRSKSQMDVFPKWQELKPLGKNIHRRSYHSCVAHENYLYVYGGYETNEGILSDFCRIPSPVSPKPFCWTNLMKKAPEDNAQDQVPGPLRNHTAVVHQNKMYMFGGKENLMSPTARLWIYDFQEEVFVEGKECIIDGKKMAVEGHQSCLWSEQQQMVVFGGFYSDTGYRSSILFYDLQKEIWSMVFKGDNNSAQFPKGESRSRSYINWKHIVYLGIFWKFDLENRQYGGLIVTEKSPGTRSSTSLLVHPQGIMLFGGIHDITHEKNDLWLYRGNEWIQLEEDTSRRQVADEMLNESAFDKASQARPQKKEKGKNEPRSFLLLDDEPKNSLHQRRNSVKNLDQKQPTDTNNNFQLNSMDELKKKRLQQKKNQMLAEFEMNEEEKSKFRSSSPTTDQIKNSISVITNQEKQGGQRKIQSPTGKKNAIQASLSGKKPCARDGHSAIVMGDIMIVFGGDRNLMSFNDIYMYSFNQK